MPAPPDWTGTRYFVSMPITLTSCFGRILPSRMSRKVTKPLGSGGTGSLEGLAADISAVLTVSLVG